MSLWDKFEEQLAGLVEHVAKENLYIGVRRAFLWMACNLSKNMVSAMDEILAACNGDKARAFDVLRKNVESGAAGAQKLVNSLDEATMQRLMAEKLERQGGPSSN